VALLVGLAVLVLTVLAIEVDWVEDVEVDAFRFVNEDVVLPFAPLWVVMQFGSVVAIYATAAVALAYRRVRLAVSLLLAGTAAWWLAKAVKAIVERGRPGDVLDGVELRHAPTDGLGFVSGHAAVASALCAAAWPFLGRWGRIASVTVVAIVCLGRVYTGAHLPIDVVGGVGLGVAIAAAVRFFVTPEPHRPAARPAAPDPEARSQESAP
jgi:membrane-associated phospholipid phosphatase